MYHALRSPLIALASTGVFLGLILLLAEPVRPGLAEAVVVDAAAVVANVSGNSTSVDVDPLASAALHSPTPRFKRSRHSMAMPFFAISRRSRT